MENSLKNVLESEPDGKSYRDSSEKNLYLRNRKTKTWYIVKKIQGKTKWQRIGTYPEMGIAAARKAAAIEKTNLITRKKQHSSATTLQDIWNSFKKDKEGINRSLDRSARIMTRPYMQVLAMKEASSITPDDIRELRRRMIQTPIMFNRVRALISVLFSYAAKVLELNLNNPAASVPKFPERAKKTRVPFEKRTLFFEELNSGKYPQQFVDIIKTLIYSGQRKSNVYEMEWKEIDFKNEVWIVPAEKSKNKEEMITPIEPKDFMRILQRRYKDPDRSPKYVFPQANNKKAHVIDIRRTYRKFCEAIGEPNLTIHDLRRSHGTWMLNSGASIEEVSASLHHSDIRVTQKVYAELLTDQIRAGVKKMWDKIPTE